MNHKTDMKAALQACVDAMLHDGVPTDPEHPRRVALNAAEAALAFGPDAQADAREAFTMWWKDISPSNFDYASALAGYLAAVDPTVAHAAAPQAEAAQGVPEGWTGNHEADSALIMLDRLDVSSDDDVRVDAISAIVRKLAAAPAPVSEPSQDREQVGEAAEAARIVKMWDDGFTQLAGSRAVELLRNASPSRERGEQDCPHGVDDGACGWCYDEKVASAPTLGEIDWREKFFAEQQARMELEAALHQVVGDEPQPQAAEPKGMTEACRKLVELRHSEDTRDYEIVAAIDAIDRVLPAKGE